MCNSMKSGLMRIFFIGVFVGVLLPGCRSEVAEEAEVEAIVAEEQQELSLGFEEPEMSRPSHPSPPRREITLDEDAGVDELFAALAQLEHDAAFTEAWQMARDYRADNPDNPRVSEVDERINRLNRLRRDAPELVYAINQLSDPNPTVRDIVQRQLVRGGEAARILLRKAVRNESAQVCALAAGLLRQMGDHEGFSDIAGRLRSTADNELRSALINVCAQMLETQNSTAMMLSAGMLRDAGTAEYISLAAAIYRRLAAEEELTAEKTAARQAANDYLLRLIKAAGNDRAILRDASAAAALSGDAQLMAEFLQPGLLYFYYETGRNQITSAHQDDTFTELEPRQSGTTDRITIDVRKRQEDIGMVFTGLIDIREEGEYTFYTTSDDGSFLFIGDEMLVDNGGLHGMQERSGKIALTAGLHPFRVTWFQAGGGLGLEVNWQGPGIEKGEIPPERFFHHLSDTQLTDAM